MEIVIISRRPFLGTLTTEHNRSSAATNVIALLILWLCVIVVGAIAGAIIYSVSTWYRVVILYPLVIGAVVGQIAALVIKNRRIRLPAVAAVIAFTGGAVGWATDMGIGYISARHSLARQIAPLRQRIAPVDRSAIDHAINVTFVKWGRGEAVTERQLTSMLSAYSVSKRQTADSISSLPPSSSMWQAAWGYMQFRAAAGTTIVPDEEDVAMELVLAKAVNEVAGRNVASYPDEKRGLGKTGTWCLWLFELACAGGFAALLAHGAYET